MFSCFFVNLHILQLTNRYNLKILGLQPSIILDNGFFQCITILSKQNLPEHLTVGITFIYTDSSCFNTEYRTVPVEELEIQKVGTYAIQNNQYFIIKLSSFEN